MIIHQNDSENIIDDPVDFCQYRIWLLSGNKGNTHHTPTIKVTTVQLDGVSNSHVFTDIKLFAYTRPVQCNVQIINVSKAIAKGFVLVIIKIQKTSISIPLWTSYLMPQNQQNTISQTALKNYNEFRNVRTEALRRVQMTTDTGIKFKVETSSKERYQQLLDFITIGILKLEQQNTSSQDIITLTINPIINSCFNKHPISWEIIHCRLLHYSVSVMKEMFRH